MKDTIRNYRLCKEEISTDETGFLKEHSLVKLWNELNPYLKENYEQIACYSTENQAIENLIFEFNQVDHGSFTFRYPFDGGTKYNSKIVYAINDMTIELNNLEKIIIKMQNYFDGINDHVVALLDELLTLNNN